VPSEDQRFPMRRGPGTDQRYGTMAATGPRPPDISGARRPASGLDQPGMAWSVKPSPRQSFEDRSMFYWVLTRPESAHLPGPWLLASPQVAVPSCSWTCLTGPRSVVRLL
jgi:hypothetical protein